MVKVVKFGGSSLASAEQFMKVGDIICEPLMNFGLIKKKEKDAVARKYLEMAEQLDRDNVIIAEHLKSVSLEGDQ